MQTVIWRKYRDIRVDNQQTKRKSKRKAIKQDQLYAKVWVEIESNSIDKGLWSRLYVENEGDENRTKAAYIESRVNQLKN